MHTSIIQALQTLLNADGEFAPEAAAKAEVASSTTRCAGVSEQPAGSSRGSSFTITLFEAAAFSSLGLTSPWTRAFSSPSPWVPGTRSQAGSTSGFMHRTQPWVESVTNLSTLLIVVLGLMVVGRWGLHVWQRRLEGHLEEALPRMEAALEYKRMLEVYSTASSSKSTENPRSNPIWTSTPVGNIYTNCPGLTCLSASTTTQPQVV